MAERHEFLTMTDEEGDYRLGLYVRGHHDRAEVLRQAVEEGYVSEYDDARLEDVRQSRYRKTPVGKYFGGGIDFWLREATGRGTFPVTFIDLENARQRRARARRNVAPRTASPAPEGM